MSITLTALQKQRTDTAANWTSANPTLLSGELGFESDTGKVKLGNGSTAWTSLGYLGVIPSSGTYPLSQLIMPLGTAGAPPLTFVGDVNTGIYSPGADQISFSTGGIERLRIDSTGQIEAVSLGTAAAPTYTFTGDPDTGVYSPGANQLAISTGGSGRLFVDSTGRVGIGTSSISTVSERVLHIYAGAGASSGLRLTGNAGTGLDLIHGTDGSGYLYQRDNAFLAIGTNNTERLRIDSSGNILKQYGTALQSYTSGGSVSHMMSYGTWNGTGNLLVVGNTFDGIVFGTGGGTMTEKARIDSSGRLGIGNNAPGNYNGVFSTVVGNTSSTNNGLVVSTSSTGSAWIGFNNTGGAEIPGYIKYDNSNSSLQFQVNNSERFRCDSSGRLLVGTSSARSNFFNSTTTAGFQAESTGEGAIVAAIRNNSSTGVPVFLLAKSKSDTIGSNTLVGSGDELGYVSFQGSDGSEFVEAARISAAVDAASGANDMPGRLVFSTTADGASSPTERMRISQNGVVTVKNGAVAEIGTLTDGATITPNFAANCNFTVTLGGNRTMANPTNVTAGQSGSLFIVQDATGNRTLNWGANWDWAGGAIPTLTTAANAVDRVDYVCRTATSIHAVWTGNYS